MKMNTVQKTDIACMRCLLLKGQCHEIFNPRFFHQTISPGPLIRGLKPFEFYFEFAEI
jgi:hypothetical protein